jgi:calreticulin
MLYKLATASMLIGSAAGKIFLQENFSGDWESRWVKSSWKEDSGEAGNWEVSAGKWFADEEKSKGLRTAEDAKFYAISTKFDSFSTEKSPLVVQFSVKHEQSIDCGGGYVKLFPSTVDQKKLQGGAEEDKYNVMFGPDICGYTKRTHVIFEYKGKNHLIKKEPRCESDEMTHLYTLLVNTDGSYEVFIDMESVQKGDLTDDWDFLPPKKIKDPAQSKPSDWVDDAKMDDPEASKPEGWDDIPKQIPDPDATQPDDWDTEDDGEWEPPTIDNPRLQGRVGPPEDRQPRLQGRVGAPGDRQPGVQGGPEHRQVQGLWRARLRALAGQVGHHLRQRPPGRRPRRGLQGGGGHLQGARRRGEEGQGDGR